MLKIALDFSVVHGVSVSGKVLIASKEEKNYDIALFVFAIFGRYFN
ncbi:hypothetical protein HID58_062300, partial [Brassica napus]